MAGTATGSLVQQFASMKATEFGPAIEPKWKLAGKLVGEVRGAGGRLCDRRTVVACLEGWSPQTLLPNRLEAEDATIRSVGNRSRGRRAGGHPGPRRNPRSRRE